MNPLRLPRTRIGLDVSGLISLSWLAMASMLACVPPAKDVGELDGADTSPDPDASATSNDDGLDGTGMNDGSDATADTGMTGTPCVADQDHDGVAIDQDNAPDVFNPDQADVDGDGIADVADLCPTVQSSPTSDSDKDGFGNACDACAGVYPSISGAADFMQIRAIPGTGDADGDGIGDACDNCVTVPNCAAFGPDMPWTPGTEIPSDDARQCQTDADDNGVGDACEGLTSTDAAGPVGLGPNDDFDQDGLPNAVDACPRLPVADAITCTGDGDCPSGRTCETTVGLCDHRDTDNDGFGDACDTCGSAPNPDQATEGLSLDDDADGDFVGRACEVGSPAGECDAVANPPPIAFYPVAVDGWCCTTQVEDQPLGNDPDGVPITVECTALQESSGVCRQLPPTVSLVPGRIELPPGCTEAMAAAGNPQGPIATDTPLDTMWDFACRLPQRDQDYDGIADDCDLCPFAFDPDNQPYVDANGTLWPDDGRYCHGDYSAQSLCEGV